MADNEQLNEEYHFSELDPINPHAFEEESGTPEFKIEPEKKGFAAGNNVKRNAIIAVVAFIVLMLSYKFIASFFTGEKVKPEEIKQPETEQPVASPIQNPVTVTPPVPVQTAPVEPQVNLSVEVESKLSTIASSQETLNTEVSSLSGQIGQINTNVDTLSTKIADLNRALSALSDKLESQSQVIERLNAKPVVKSVRHHVIMPKHHYMRYYLQAVIPGRAWIVATNGSTLTVREGSTVPGYGVVKLIDSNEGRILTTSGKVIRFSQEDS